MAANLHVAFLCLKGRPKFWARTRAIFKMACKWKVGKTHRKIHKYAIYIEISQLWRYGIKMELTCHLWVSRTSLTSTIEGLGEEVELINTCMTVYVLHIRNKLSLISARKKLPSAIKVSLWSNSFYVSAEALLHGGPLVIRSERRSAKPRSKWFTISRNSRATRSFDFPLDRTIIAF